MAALGAGLIFATGVAAAALADMPPPTDTTTTSTTTTTTTTSTTTTTATTTTTSTTTSTVPTTTSTPTTSTTTPARVTPRGGSAPPRPRSTPPQGLRGATPESPAASNLASGRSPRKKRRHRVSKPLKVTPPLGQPHFIFPVVGPADYGDSYGADRSDVHGKWHHGDDIFAPLGAPVVAVASGAVNRVGWERVGGWRLWVRDRAADEFYYAHLSGYTRSVFHSRYVRAGQVIGFVGNTGDAYGGVPHLHFEIHPRQLLRLRYDGAVDPTTYLDGWTHVQHVRVPPAVHPRLPAQPGLRLEATQVFRRLLAAQRTIEERGSADQTAQPAVPAGADDRASVPPVAIEAAPAAAARAEPDGTPLMILALAGGVASVLLCATALLQTRLRQRRIRRQAASETV
jgi:murein DD-endopeptidase MepM/ murein hydrolase activator NlpD